jgi:hypothetical protein
MPLIRAAASSSAPPALQPSASATPHGVKINKKRPEFLIKKTNPSDPPEDRASEV